MKYIKPCALIGVATQALYFLDLFVNVALIIRLQGIFKLWRRSSQCLEKKKSVHPKTDDVSRLISDIWILRQKLQCYFLSSRYGIYITGTRRYQRKKHGFCKSVHWCRNRQHGWGPVFFYVIFNTWNYLP